jgi:hypothetical protein
VREPREGTKGRTEISPQYLEALFRFGRRTNRERAGTPIRYRFSEAPLLGRGAGRKLRVAGDKSQESLGKTVKLFSTVVGRQRIELWTRGLKVAPGLPRPIRYKPANR